MTLHPLALTDRAELTDLVSRLGRWLDDGATGDPAALFADDVRVSTPGGDSTGVAAIVAQAQRNHDAPTQHVIANVLADVDGDAAHVTANMVVTFADTETAAAPHRRDLRLRRDPDRRRLALLVDHRPPRVARRLSHV